MKLNLFTQAVLVLIALFLGMIVLRQFVAPTVAKAQSPDVYLFYIEPGTRMLRAPDNGRQVLGKVVVDLRNGNILGISNADPGAISHRRIGKYQTTHITPVPVGEVRFRSRKQMKTL